MRRWITGAALGGLFLAGSLLFFSAPDPQDLSKKIVPEGKVAAVTIQESLDTYRIQSGSEWETFNEPQKLFLGSRLRVDDGHMMVLGSNSGYILKVIGAAELVVDMWSEAAVLLRVIYGDVEVQRQGERGSLYVLKETKLYAPERQPMGAAPTLTIPRQPRPEVRPKGLKLPPPIERTENPEKPSDELAGQTLEDTYLDQVVAKQKLQFVRCQTNAVRESQPATGELLVGFEISQRGRTEKIRVLSSTVKNPQLEACVVSVFERLQFKKFSGQRIARSYPLVFE